MDPRRGCLTVVGALLVLLGIPMLVCPGPGLLVIGIGISLILTGRVVREMDASVRERPADEIIDVEYEVLDAEAPLPVSEGSSGGEPPGGRSSAEVSAAESPESAAPEE